MSAKAAPTAKAPEPAIACRAPSPDRKHVCLQAAGHRGEHDDGAGHTW